MQMNSTCLLHLKLKLFQNCLPVWLTDKAIKTINLIFQKILSALPCCLFIMNLSNKARVSILHF